MKVHLSNIEVRAYRKKSGYISFCLKTVLLAEYGYNFPIDTLDLKAICKLKTGKRFEFRIAMHYDSDFKFDGNFSTTTLDMKTVTDLKTVENQTVEIQLTGSLGLPHTTEIIEYSQTGVLKKMYFGL